MGAGSLRAAVAGAIPGDTITIPASVPTVTLSSAQIPITQSLTINGQGSGATTIDTPGHNIRAFDVDFVGTATIRNLTITGAEAPDGTSPGGGSGTPGEAGGAILNH